jgi:hypothetical protein
MRLAALADREAKRSINVRKISPNYDLRTGLEIAQAPAPACLMRDKDG